jgi:hypothetical protein
MLAIDSAMLSAFEPRSLSPLSDAFTPQARAQRVWLLVAGTFLFCLGDLYMTLVYALNIGLIEMNPVARSIMQYHPISVVIGWKILTMLFFSAIMLRARHTRVAELAAWGCFGVMTALCFHWYSYSQNISQFTQEFSALALADDPRWIHLDDDHASQLRRLAQATSPYAAE